MIDLRSQVEIRRDEANALRQLKWDRRFLTMADLVASFSKDPSSKVGAVIVRPDLTVASVGYNGFPRGLSDSDELYADRDVKLSRVVHAELNAILNAHETVTGNTLYITVLSCDRCAAHVIQSGIKRVVAYPPSAAMQERWGKTFDAARSMYAEAGVELVELPLVGEIEPFPEENTKLNQFMTVRVTMPSVDGQQIAACNLNMDMLLLETCRGVDVSTDDARLAHVRKIGEAAALVAHGNR